MDTVIGIMLVIVVIRLLADDLVHRNDLAQHWDTGRTSLLQVGTHSAVSPNRRSTLSLRLRRFSPRWEGFRCSRRLPRDAP